jgi:FkbM family methyltransferase
VIRERHRDRVETVLCAARLYRPARNLYQRVSNRPEYEERRGRRALYRQLVPSGAIVFDVGANHGRYTEMFIELGASRVVAVEPNPELATLTRRRYRSKRVAVEQVAAGATAGSATLHLGEHDGHSTMSSEWMRHASPLPNGRSRWSRTLTVPVKTLDQLIEKYGVPHLVKIDVEGFEPEVLRGLSWSVAGISFEFQCSALDLTRDSLELISRLGDYRFNLCVSSASRLLKAEWIDGSGLLAELHRLCGARCDAYGEVFARRAP